MIVGTCTHGILDTSQNVIVVFVETGKNKDNRILQLLEQYIPGISQLQLGVGADHLLPAWRVKNRKLIIIASIFTGEDEDLKLITERIHQVFNRIDSHLTIATIVPGVRANGQNDPHGQDALVEVFAQLKHKVTIYYDAANPPASLPYIEELITAS